MISLVFCWLWLQTPNQTPLETWATLIKARVTRHAAPIPPSQFNLDTQSQLVMQEYLLTIGQNGHPDAAKVILSYLSHPQLQSTALFAYGELGAPMQPLLNANIADKNRLFWWEALAKTATDQDDALLLQRWRKAVPSVQMKSLRFLYRRSHDGFKQAVLQKLEQRPSGNNGELFFYLFRNDVPISKALFLTQLANRDNNTQALLFLLRLAVPDADLGVVQALIVQTSASDWRVRVNAINALGTCKAAQGPQPSPFMSVVPRLLEDPNPNVVDATLTQLVQLNDPTLDQWLEPRLTGLSQAQKVVVLENMEGARKERYLYLIQNWLKTNSQWQLRQWITHKGPSKPTLVERWIEPSHKGLATLAYRVLTHPDNPSHRRRITNALSSNDPYLAGTAAAALADNPSIAGAYLPSINTLLRKTYPEPDFHYAVIDGLASLVPDADTRRRMLQQLQRHPDYLVRLKAVDAAQTVNFAQRRNLFNRPWKNAVPPEISYQAAQFAQGAAEPTWLIQTNRGDIRIQLRSSYAPITCANIVYLSKRKYFDKMPIHRVVPNFVIQAGDSRGDGSGGPGHTIPCEINTLRYQRGTVGMALAGKDTGGSQWFICHSAQPHLDGNYTVFGKVREGMSVVDRLEEGDTILRARIIE